MKKAYLTFPAGSLSGEALRLPLLSLSDDWIALEKPSSISMTEKEAQWEGSGDTSLIQAIRHRLREKSPSFLSLFQDGWSPIYYLERNCGGVILLARSSEASARLKDRYGSYLWKMRFTLFTRQSPMSDPLLCELPIANKRSSPMSFVSHKKGKKACTTFSMEGRLDNVQMWTAEMTYLRNLQVPLHSHESALKIAGENRFGEPVPPITRRDLPGYRRPGDERHILWKEPAYFLTSLEMDDGTRIESAPPKVFQKLRAQFGK